MKLRQHQDTKPQAFNLELAAVHASMARGINLPFGLSAIRLVFSTQKQPEKEKESSYHTFLVGLLTGNTDWVVRSNVEAGEGFADIIIEPEDPDAGIILELKYSKEANGLEKACEKAIEQIKDRRYSEYLINDGRHNITLYGIAFYKKRSKAVVEKISS